MDRSRSICTFSLFAAVTALALSGCGGSASVTQPTASGKLGFAGSSTVTTTSSGSTTVPASGGTIVGTSDSGTGGTAVIPSGAVPPNTVLPAGTQLAVIPLGTGFPGTFAADGAMGVNGNLNSGVGVSGSGVTTVNAALPVTDGTNGTPDGTFYTLTFPGGDLSTTPRTKRSTAPATGVATPEVLTIQNTVFTGQFYVRIVSGRPAVISPVPIYISGRIPNNGQNASGATVACQFGPGNIGRSATLTIDYGNGFQLRQTRTISNNSVGFSDIQRDSSNVPVTGVQLLQFDIGPL